MKDFPPVPRLADAPEGLFEAGHLWIVEKVDGAPLRFQLRRSGRIRFGDRDRAYEDPEAMPEPYAHAVRHVRTNLDRGTLREAVDDVEAFVFFGEAMHRHAIDYDWDRTPSFLGFDVWSAEAGRFRPPDAVEGIFERLGLRAVNVFERELRARDFDPDAYAVPESAWYDGPAEGVVLRDKRGNRAQLLGPDAGTVDEETPAETSAPELAAAYATRRRFERLAAGLEAQGRPVTFQPLYERVLEGIVREAHARLYRDDVDASEFRSAVAARTREFLEDGRPHGGDGP
jgi:hypothetical protein